MSVEVIIEDPRWSPLGIEECSNHAAAAVLSHVGLRPDDWEIAILACNDPAIAELNRAFRGKASPTNVLSWPSAERRPGQAGAAPVLPDLSEGPELGDIAIAFDTTTREAETADRPVEHHVIHLLVHAVLHLLGYDHEDDRDAARMEREEVEILASLGVPNPY